MSDRPTPPTTTPRRRSFSFGWNSEFRPLVGMIGSPPGVAGRMPMVPPGADNTVRARSLSSSSTASTGSAIDDLAGPELTPPRAPAHQRSASMTGAFRNLSRVPTIDEERILKGELLF